MEKLVLAEEEPDVGVEDHVGQDFDHPGPEGCLDVEVVAPLPAAKCLSVEETTFGHLLVALKKE